MIGIPIQPESMAAIMIPSGPAIIDLFNQNSVFHGLPQQQIEQLFEISERKKYNKNQAVFTVDQQARYFYLVESGSFILNLRDRKFKLYKQGDIFGEVGIINENVRSGTIRSVEESSLIAINGTLLFDKRFLSPESSLIIVRGLAKLVTNYLRTREQISTAELIERGENEFVEFKSSMRWNHKTQNTDRLIEQPIIRTLAAFLNSKGGTLLIGVRDDGKILGIGQDRFENQDKMLLHLTELIKQRISTLHMKFIHYEIEEISYQQILRIDIEPASIPAYTKEGKSGESFYVRTGPSTTDLKVSKIFDYIRTRF